MSSISNFNNNTYLYNNNTWRPENSYVADGEHALPVKYIKEPYLTKDDARKRITEVLESARKYEEKQDKHIDMANVHGPQEAILDAVLALGDDEFARLQRLREVLREYTNRLDLGDWIDVMRGEGGSIKKHKKEKRRRHTKRRRLTKRRRPTKRRR